MCVRVIRHRWLSGARKQAICNAEQRCRADPSVRLFVVRSHVGNTPCPALVLRRRALRQSPSSVRRFPQPLQRPC